MSQMQMSGVPINLSSSGAIGTTSGSMIGYHVNSTSGGTLVFRNGGSGGTAVSGTITPIIGFQAFPAYFSSASGGYVTISGTIDITVFWAAG